MRNLRKQNVAFTLVELMVVITVLAILAASLLPALAHIRPQAQRADCANNLKLVGVAFRTWAADNNGRMPMNVSPTPGGSGGDVGRRMVASSQSASAGVCNMFLCLSNHLSTPKTLFCPAEFESASRHLATTFAGTVPADTNAVPYTNDLNVSYFVGVDASESLPRMLLLGDHNLGDNANPPTIPYQAAVTANQRPFISLGTNFIANAGPSFMDHMHAKQGNVGMVDGRVEWFNRSHFQDAVKNTGDAGRTGGGFALAAGAMGFGCNRIQLP